MFNYITKPIYSFTGNWVISNISEGLISPSSLFGNGEDGVWYNPSDINTLFQDSGGTTPVTADGDPVGRMLDKSGNGNHAIQTVSADRPVYDVNSSMEYLAFNGNNSGLDSGISRSIWGQSFSASFWLYFNDNSRATIFSNFDGDGYAFEKTTDNEVRIFYNRAIDFFTAQNTIPINERFHCVIIRDVSSDNFRVYINKALIFTSTSAGNHVLQGSDTVLLGRDSRTGVTVLDGNLGNTVIVNKVLSQSEIDSLYDFE
jgi:hypothetical protein